jgi:hypothetical protein
MSQCKPFKMLFPLIIFHYITHIFCFCRYYPDLEVNWINFVRHPVDRYTSNFYYLRSERRWNNTLTKPDLVTYCFILKLFYLKI